MSRADDVGLAKRYGPWALVTGASDGIGMAFAAELAQAGVNLVLVARRQTVLEALAESLRDKHCVACKVVAVDLANADAIESLLHATRDTDIGLLVAAAGFGTSGPLIASSLLVETEMLDVNCRAVLALTWHFGQRFAARKRGGIILMSSILAFQGAPRAANYAATKAYIQTLAEGLQVELSEHGVDVLASAPGPIQSGFAQRANMNMSQTMPSDVVARVTLNALGDNTTVRPGWLSKLLGWSLNMLPRWGRVMIITRIVAGMTRAA